MELLLGLRLSGGGIGFEIGLHAGVDVSEPCGRFEKTAATELRDSLENVVDGDGIS